MNKRLNVLLAAIVVASASAASQQTAAADPAPAREDALQAEIQALVPRLGSDDFSVRDKAQAELQKMDYHATAALRRVAAASEDAEVRNRLLARVEELDEQCALDPPPLTLSLKDAAWPELVAALKDGGISVRGNPDTKPRFTLEVHDKPLWEVFQQIAAQDSVTIESAGFSNGINFTRDEKDPLKNFSSIGPFLFAPLKLERTTSFQDDGGHTSAMTFHFMVVIDPRMRIVRAYTPALTSVIDDAGNDIAGKAEAEEQDWQYGDEKRWVVESKLAAPAKMGHKIVIAKGHFKVEVAVATSEMTIDDPAKLVGKPFDFHGRKITVTKFSRGEDGQINFAATVDGGARRDRADSPDSSAIFDFLNSEGESLGQYVCYRGGHHFGYGWDKGPITVRLRVATKTKALDIPFEFKDLPTP